MPAFQSLAPRSPAGLETIHNILGSLVARYRQEEVLTAVRQIPAREAKFCPVPAWVTSTLAEAYRAKGIRELYSHQASTAELVWDGKNVVVVTPTASGKTLSGPAASALKVPPTDLTTLAKRNGGSFPFARVSNVIRLGGDVAAHGSEDMPMWGRTFSSLSQHEDAVVQQRIANLVNYIRSLQEK